MTIHKFTIRFNINPDRGSGTFYVKKEDVEKLKFTTNTNLFAMYDDEKGVSGELLVRDL